MTKTQTVKVLIRKGEITTLYDDEIAQALQKGLKAKAEVKRISHVEPVPGPQEEIQFTADLTPIKGPILTGFKTYKEAIAAEVDWITENHLTTKKPAETP